MTDEYEFQKALRTLKPTQPGGQQGTSVPNAQPSEIEQVRSKLKHHNIDPGTNPVVTQPTPFQTLRGQLRQQQETPLEQLVREINEGRHGEEEGARLIREAAGRLRAHRKHEVNRSLSQKMSGMTQSTWNSSYTWRAKFAMYFVDKELLLEIRAGVKSGTGGGDPIELLYRWRMEISKKWQSLAVVWKDYKDDSEHTFPVRVMMTWESNALQAHCLIKPNLPLVPGAGGTHGVGGTSSMTEWGTGDPLDIPHEVGHMLGAPDNYGKIEFDACPAQSIDWPKGRVTGLGIMNNPDEYPVSRNLWLVAEEMSDLMLKHERGGEVLRIINIGR